MKYLPTYDDAQEICKKYDNFNFSEHQYKIRGFKISTFDYFICGYNDFANPLNERPEVNAFDLRGITFVFNKDGSLWKRFLMLPKFFNLNQIEETQYSKIKDKKIDHISVKEDGSLIAFMMTPDYKIFSKTIRGFDNEQAIRSYQIIYKDEKIVNWIKDLILKEFTPLFEYVSWNNRIVLKYTKEELRFIGLRNNKTGKFVPSSRIIEILGMGVPQGIYVVPEVNSSLDKLIDLSKTEEDKEGWVVIFKDGLWIKVKTKWYFNLHGIRTENIFREDYVIKNYYKETLDDLVSQLNKDDDKDTLDFVNKVTSAIDNYSKYIDKCVIELVNIFHNSYNNN